MKSFIFATTASALALASLPQSVEAAERLGARSEGARKAVSRPYARSAVDRLPIRITRPPNTGHYVHQDFPLWAARAFQPTRSR